MLPQEDGTAGSWHVANLPKADLGGCGPSPPPPTTTPAVPSTDAAALTRCVRGWPAAYPRVDVPFADGKKYTFYRRERPHIVLGPDGFTLVGLTTAVSPWPLAIVFVRCRC